MTKDCNVPECPALAANGKATCQIHAFARLAKGLWYAGKNLSRLSCASCKRKLQKGDWVYDEPGKAPRHVRCEPVAPRKTSQAMRDEPKPLFEVIDDVATNRRTA